MVSLERFVDQVRHHETRSARLVRGCLQQVNAVSKLGDLISLFPAKVIRTRPAVPWDAGFTGDLPVDSPANRALATCCWLQTAGALPPHEPERRARLLLGQSRRPSRLRDQIVLSLVGGEQHCEPPIDEFRFGPAPSELVPVPPEKHGADRLQVDGWVRWQAMDVRDQVQRVLLGIVRGADAEPFPWATRS